MNDDELKRHLGGIEERLIAALSGHLDQRFGDLSTKIDNRAGSSATAVAEARGRAEWDLIRALELEIDYLKFRVSRIDERFSRPQ